MELAPTSGIVIAGIAPDSEGYLSGALPGEVVLSLPSPESLASEPDIIAPAVDGAGKGAEPLVVVVQDAEFLREEELRPLVEAAQRAPRTVILRVIRATDG